MKLFAPDGAVTSTVVQGPRGKRTYNSNVVEAHPDDVRALRSEGYTPTSLTGTSGRGSGRRCTSCGFGSWFTVCSRCGGPCVKEQADE